MILILMLKTLSGNSSCMAHDQDWERDAIFFFFFFFFFFGGGSPFFNLSYISMMKLPFLQVSR